MFANGLGNSLSSLRINPAVVVGLGNFGGAALKALAGRLGTVHPVLAQNLGWLWLDGANWRSRPPEHTPDPAATGTAPVKLASDLLAQACDLATSQAAVSALRDAGYQVGTVLDTVVVGRVDDPLTRGALVPVLDQLRTLPALRENRVTLFLVTDSRNFGPEALTLTSFFDALADRLVADRENPVAGSISWCYLCDALDVDGRLLGTDGSLPDLVQAQLDLVLNFTGLLLGSGLRREPAYGRTALPDLAHDLSAPAGAALVSSFGLGAYVLPVESIAALARDQLALRLHPVAFPSQPSVTDREVAEEAYRRLAAVIDLSPRALREHLLRGSDGAAIRFDTTPPDLTGLDADTALQALARWRNNLESRWTDEDAAPPKLIGRNADQLFEELAGEVRSEVDSLVKADRRGLHRGLNLLSDLPSLFEGGRIQAVADDGDYLRWVIPSADNEFRELGDLTTKRFSPWTLLVLANVVFVPLAILSFIRELDFWPVFLVVWLVSMFSITLITPWRYRRRVVRQQAAFITAVQGKFQSGQQRTMREKRRELFDRWLAAVELERKVLLDWGHTIVAAGEALGTTEADRLQLAFGERALCPAAEYPSPLTDYGDEKLAQVAEHYLGSAGRPNWRVGREADIVAWLRGAATRELAGWRETISVAHWRPFKPAEALDRLIEEARPQWPLAVDERRQHEQVVLGLPDREQLPLVVEESSLLPVSTADPARLSCVRIYHGMRLRRMAATRPLWGAPASSPAMAASDDLHQSFVWRYSPAGEPVEHRLSLTLSRPHYQTLRARPRPRQGEWAPLVTETSPELDALADALSGLHRQQDWSSLERAGNVLAFVQQSIRFSHDHETTSAREWPRYPLETLVEGTGDCEDDVILAAAILKRLGYEVALLYYPGHCALGVGGADDLPGHYVADPQTGVKYFYGEVTPNGRELGEVPPEYRQIPPTGIEIIRMVVE